MSHDFHRHCAYWGYWSLLDKPFAITQCLLWKSRHPGTPQVANRIQWTQASARTNRQQQPAHATGDSLKTTDSFSRQIWSLGFESATFSPILDSKVIVNVSTLYEMIYLIQINRMEFQRRVDVSARNHHSLLCGRPQGRHVKKTCDALTVQHCKTLWWPLVFRSPPESAASNPILSFILHPHGYIIHSLGHFHSLKMVDMIEGSSKDCSNCAQWYSINEENYRWNGENKPLKNRLVRISNVVPRSSDLLDTYTLQHMSLTIGSSSLGVNI
jgi:hypothetical protein